MPLFNINIINDIKSIFLLLFFILKNMNNNEKILNIYI